jgi:hypothetical protein
MNSAKQLRDLSNVLNTFFSALKKSDGPLKMLPTDSWAAQAQPSDDKLEIEVVRNERLLLASSAPQMSSEMYWYAFIIPQVAKMLSKFADLLPENLVVRFIFESENGKRTFSCKALDLVSNVDEISSANGFGAMMALMELE